MDFDADRWRKAAVLEAARLKKMAALVLKESANLMIEAADLFEQAAAEGG